MATNITGNTRGVFIISVTPFTDGGSIDWASVDSVTEFYLGCGVNGITILGMMGEAHKLTDPESAAFAPARPRAGRRPRAGDRRGQQRRHRSASPDLLEPRWTPAPAA